MNTPVHEILTFNRDGSFKISKRAFWLVSNIKDAYGKNISEGDRVRVFDEMCTYTASFDGNAFIMLDNTGLNNGLLADFDPCQMAIVGHVTDED